jgi:glutathione S-transferase
MILVFHSFPRSTATQKVRLCQHHKGVRFDDDRLVDLLRFQQLDPAYLALNPSGLVPTLVVDGRPICESSIINEFLEDCFPERTLVPRDPRVRAEMRMWTKYIDTGPTVQIATPTYKAWVAPGVAAHPDRAGLLALVASVPEASSRARWQRTVHDSFSDEDITSAWQAITVMLTRMEHRLAAGPWLFGETYSLADVETTPLVVRIGHLGRAELLAGFPRVSEWFARVQQLPNFAPTYAFLADM